MKNILKIENLTYKKILKNISLSLEEKTFNVLLGNNGSGKTTLIKCINGLLNYEGQIIFEDCLLVSDKENAQRQKIGTFIYSDVFIEGNAFENIIYPLTNLGYSKEESKKMVYDITKKLGIDRILFKNIDDLSYYEKKLVRFTRSVVHKPSLVLIDDSLDDLDNNYKNKIISYLKKIKSTVLFVTNNPEDTMLGDTIIFMNDGKIIKKCAAEDVMENEKKFTKVNSKLPFIADLISKLSSYELVDQKIVDIEELVNEIWK